MLLIVGSVAGLSWWFWLLLSECFKISFDDNRPYYYLFCVFLLLVSFFFFVVKFIYYEYQKQQLHPSNVHLFFFLHLRFVFVSVFSHSKKFQVLVVFKHFNTTGRFIVGALHFEHKILNFQLFVLFTNKSRNLTTTRPQKRGGKERTLVAERNLFTFSSKVFIMFFFFFGNCLLITNFVLVFFILFPENMKIKRENHDDGPHSEKRSRHGDDQVRILIPSNVSICSLTFIF